MKLLVLTMALVFLVPTLASAATSNNKLSEMVSNEAAHDARRLWASCDEAPDPGLLAENIRSAARWHTNSFHFSPQRAVARVKKNAPDAHRDAITAANFSTVVRAGS